MKSTTSQGNSNCLSLRRTRLLDALPALPDHLDLDVIDALDRIHGMDAMDAMDAMDDVESIDGTTSGCFGSVGGEMHAKMHVRNIRVSGIQHEASNFLLQHPQHAADLQHPHANPQPRPQPERHNCEFFYRDRIPFGLRGFRGFRGFRRYSGDSKEADDRRNSLRYHLTMAGSSKTPPAPWVITTVVPIMAVVWSVLGTIAYFTNPDPTRIHAVKDLTPVVLSTVAFICTYGILSFRQGMGNEFLKDHCKKCDINPEQMSHVRKNLDRAFLNTHEQFGNIMVSMWIYGVFVNPLRAGILGMSYVVLVMIYPLVYGTKLHPLSTIPRYWIFYYMLLSTVICQLRHEYNI
ncbi:hypothetical protein AAMO2058_001328500 [Amorphochlora amoebiformis]